MQSVSGTQQEIPAVLRQNPLTITNRITIFKADTGYAEKSCDAPIKGWIMAFDIRFDREKKILFVTLRGRFTPAEFQTAMEKITQSNQYPPNTDALWDLREMDFTRVDTDYWRSIIHIRKQYKQRGTARIAHIVKGDFAFGMLRMYQIYSELEPGGLPQRIEVFKSISEGEQWLLSR